MTSVITLAVACLLMADSPATQPAELTGLAAIRAQAIAVVPLVTTDLAKNFLAAADDLPAIPKRPLYVNPDTKRYYSEARANSLPRAERAKLKPVAADEQLYYTTKYGTPLAYARPLEILAKSGFNDAAGKRILDYGYGTIGHLRLLALLGADATGVDVDPLLAELYGDPTDQGAVKSRTGTDGRVTLIHGRWPSESDAYRKVGDGYDLIISKNTLKNGYLHPAQKVDKRMLIDLGCPDLRFVMGLYAALKPGGRVLIYNICPAPTPPGPKYKPWSDGRCPFPKKMWEETGFRVIEFDKDDTAAVQAMARAFGWDKGQGAMDVDHDLVAHYTLVEKPATK